MNSSIFFQFLSFLLAAMFVQLENKTRIEQNHGYAAYKIPADLPLGPTFTTAT